MKRTSINYILILLVCLVLTVLLLPACTSRGGQTGEPQHADVTPDLVHKITPEPEASGTPIPEKTDPGLATDEPAGTDAPAVTDEPAVTGTPVSTNVATATAEPPNTDIPAETGTPAATSTPSGTETPGPETDPTAVPPEKTPDTTATASGSGHITKNPGTDITPGPSDNTDPGENTEKPNETVPGQDPETLPTPTPTGSILIDDHGTIILPEIPIP